MFVESTYYMTTTNLGDSNTIVSWYYSNFPTNKDMTGFSFCCGLCANQMIGGV